MKLRTTEFSNRQCPKCSRPVPGAVVYAANPSFQPSYTYQNCPTCGESTARVVKIGHPTLLVEPISDRTERTAVLTAARIGQGLLPAN